MEAKTANAPFLKIILPAVTGIVLSRFMDVPDWAAVVCAAAVMSGAVFTRNLAAGRVYLWLSVMFFFFAVSEIRTPDSSLPAGEKIIVAAQVSEKPYTKGRWQMTTADVGYYRPAAGGGSGWIRVNERIMLSIDTSYHDIGVGSQLAFRGWYNAIDTTGSAYGNLMRMRGLHGRMYLVEGNLLSLAPHVSRTPGYYASVMQAAAIERLERLDMDDDDKAVVTAMTAGDKRSVDNELRNDYSRTGAAHLLAVSGLHVGIVFMLINIILYLLPVMWRGHVVKNVIAILAIWLYSMSAGLAPSVVRSALMFSFAQVALATTSYRNALNIMLGSAVVMLAVNPYYATDPSFLLSYTAVLSILLFFNPLYNLIRTRWKALNALLSVMVVGFVATMGTAPLVAYWFGNFPFVGMLINPVVIFTAHVIVMAGVLWVIMPAGFLEPLFSWILSLSAGAQNAVVSWSASLGWASFGVKLPLWAVLLIYSVYIALAVFLHGRKKEKSLSLRV